MTDSVARVSIVVNNYNYERFLAASIESALAQTHPNTEVVVVDDGSTDGSRELIARYSDRVVPVFKENGGQGSAFNAGFAASRGDIILFLDADDVLFSNAVDRIVRVWREGVSTVQFPLRFMDANGVLVDATVPPGKGRRTRVDDSRERILATGRPAAAPTNLNAFSRPALQRLLPVPDGPRALQADAYLRLASPFVGEVVSLEEPLGGYRVHGNNAWAMNRLDPGRLREYLEFDEWREAFLRELGESAGFQLPAGWRAGLPAHLQVRLASLRLEPAAHPYREDQALRLASLGIRSCLRNPFMSVRKRLFYAGWFALVGLLPMPAARLPIELSFLPARRPPVLQRLIS